LASIIPYGLILAPYILTTKLFLEAEYHRIPFGRGLRVPSLFGLARSFIPEQPTSLDDDSTRRRTNFLRHSLGRTHIRWCRNIKPAWHRLFLTASSRSSNGQRALSGPYCPIGALQNKQSPLRQDCDPIRWDLAITRLDWFLTPNPRLEDRFARQDPCRPPAGFRPPSSYPGIDRLVSSLTAMTKTLSDLSPRLALFREQCCANLVSLRLPFLRLSSP
jgi:hypothetical protein